SSASPVSNASIFRLAIFRDSSRSPLCPCNAPQQFCASGMTISHPAYCNNFNVASFVGLNIVSMRQPEKKATFLFCFILGNKCRGLRFIPKPTEMKRRPRLFSSVLSWEINVGAFVSSRFASVLWGELSPSHEHVLVKHSSCPF